MMEDGQIARGTDNRICAGIDGGSRATKVVLLDAETGEALASGVRPAGIDPSAPAEALLTELMARVGAERERLAFAVATGYARNSIASAAATVTEITCHAIGVRRLVPDAATVIEIGGQDSKVVRLDADGVVEDFAMNDRCASGTGRFLEVVAERLGLGLREFGELAARSKTPSQISSTCVVFAETEIVGLLASGGRPEDIAAGVERSIAARVASMAGRDVRSPVVFTGGVALVPGMAGALSDVLKAEVAVSPDPQMTGALGAAIVARRRLRAG